MFNLNLRNIISGINHFFYDWRMMASGWNPSVPSCSAISGAECSISVPASRQLWKDATSWISKPFSWDLKPVCCMLSYSSQASPRNRSLENSWNAGHAVLNLQVEYLYSRLTKETVRSQQTDKPTNKDLCIVLAVTQCLVRQCLHLRSLKPVLHVCRSLLFKLRQITLPELCLPPKQLPQSMINDNEGSV